MAEPKEILFTMPIGMLNRKYQPVMTDCNNVKKKGWLRQIDMPPMNIGEVIAWMVKHGTDSEAPSAPPDCRGKQVLPISFLRKVNDGAGNYSHNVPEYEIQGDIIVFYNKYSTIPWGRFYRDVASKQFLPTVGGNKLRRSRRTRRR